MYFFFVIRLLRRSLRSFLAMTLNQTLPRNDTKPNSTLNDTKPNYTLFDLIHFVYLIFKGAKRNFSSFKITITY